MAVFNTNNTAHKTGDYPLFLGQTMGLYDSINTPHPELFDLYKMQKAQDWSEDEVDLSHSLTDFKLCSKPTYDVMVQTLMWQWEADSVASQSIISMFSPFISNSECFAMMMKQSEIECLIEGTEVLTHNGWKDISKVTNEDFVAQYEKSGHKISFVNPSRVISKHFSGELISFKTPQGHFNQVVTPNHRMIAVSRNGAFKEDLAETMDYGWGFGGISSGIAGGSKKILTPVEKFLIASQADGCISERYDGSLVGTVPVWFGLSKQRKIDRLLGICQDCGFTITELTGAPQSGNTKAKRKFKVDVPKRYKEHLKDFSWVSFADIGVEWGVKFLEEVSVWDGHKTSKNISRLTSTNKNVVDTVQGVASISGMKTYRSEREDNRKDSYKTCHIVSWKPKIHLMGNEIAKEPHPYAGNVYCLTVPSSYFLVRYKGAVSVTGNCLHALTYSDIVRQCLPNSREIITDIMDNQEVLGRSGVIVKYMRELEVLGCHYRLDPSSVDHEDLRRGILRALFALIGLEGIEFISSFACTFALAEQGVFIGIGQLVQKIMLDEMLHTKMDFAVLDIILRDPVWRSSFENIKQEIKDILDEVRVKEYAWADYIFSEGRSIIGLNVNLLNEWTDYNCAPIYDYFDISRDFEAPSKDPLPFMDTWMNPSKQQNANQEQTNTDYKLNTTINDAEEEDFDFD